jgi:hypothetical protein
MPAYDSNFRPHFNPVAQAYWSVVSVSVVGYGIDPSAYILNRSLARQCTSISGSVNGLSTWEIQIYGSTGPCPTSGGQSERRIQVGHSDPGPKVETY